MQEIWKDVPGYEGLYQVSNVGRVKSVYRIINRNRGYVARKEVILKPCIRRRYLFVQLSKNGKQKNFFVHRLVAMAFIDNPKNYPQIDHINGDKYNNSVDNLRWVTAKENSNNPNASNSPIGKTKKGKVIIQCDLQGNPIKEWASSVDIQRKFGYWRGNITNCCLGVVKTSYGYIWRYKL